MSIAVMTTVWAGSRHSGSELLMLLALADFSDDGGNSYPAVATLARKCRMKPRNANYVLAALQASGELQVRPNGGHGGTNRYRIVLKALQAGAGVQPSAGVQGDAGLQPSAPTPATECAKPLQRSADKPSLNRQEPSKVERLRTTGDFDASLIELPEWLPRDCWTAWVADRKDRRKPITQRAAQAQLKTLDRYRADGHQAADVIAHSIASGYQGLYPPKVASSLGSLRPPMRPVLAADELFTGAPR